MEGETGMIFTKENLGQYFTPSHIVQQMIELIENKGVILEPSCGPGAFLNQLPETAIGIELDKSITSGNSIDRVRLNGFNNNTNYSQHINAQIKKTINEYEKAYANNHSNILACRTQHWQCKR